jgi:anti-sigma-K factor RskA
MSIQPDDGRLTRYLLGTLPEEEREHLDELSIVDDDVALRLRVTEDELIDAYVRGELNGSTLERFEAEYLSTPERRSRVQFAQTLRGERPVRRSFVWAIAASIFVAAVVGGLVVATRDDAPREVVTKIATPTEAVRSVSILLQPPTRAASARGRRLSPLLRRIARSRLGSDHVASGVPPLSAKPSGVRHPGGRSGGEAL